MNKFTGILALAGALLLPAAAATPKKLVLQAEDAQFDSERLEVVAMPKPEAGKGVALKPASPSRIDNPVEPPDLIFTVKVAEPGRYHLATVTATRDEARKKMNATRSKHDSLRVMVAVDDDFPRRLVLVSPWKSQDGCFELLNKHHFGDGEHLVKIWLPAGAILDRLEVVPYNPPKVPEAARNYQPAIVPPATHPRIWVTEKSLPQIKANLTKPENERLWKKVQAEAAKKVEYRVEPGVAGEYDPRIQNAAATKAFVAMMTGDAGLAREAAELMYEYMSRVEFDNMLDITRELGSTIYSGSLVYDWCHSFLSDEQRQVFRDALLRLAEDMEIGWPPFGQIVVNGHGNEAQVNRDLLAMGIALYGEDDEPYRYCAYRLLEELVPLRAYEYLSGRHNQGIGYASFRFFYEMHAAWLLRRLADKEVFHPGIKTVFNHFLYGRLPDGSMMLDGDGSLDTGYWHSPQLAFMCYTYSGDPLVKGEFLAGGGLDGEPLLFLLLNDPDLKPETDFKGLPLTHFFPGALASMIARTGWNFGRSSEDVFVEMKGGRFNFANHQHLDAGAFQIFYRGYLATDLGMYAFYGTPYDMSFNKRSIPHNLMLVYDKDEKFPGNRINDGGQRTILRCPENLEDLEKNAELFLVGETLAVDFGPDRMRPFYSYFKSDLAAAYSDKVKSYTRTFLFLNMADFNRPALLLTVDRLETADPNQKKYWTVNSLTKPEMTGAGLEILSPRPQLPGKLTVQAIRPADFTYEICGGEKLHDIFGVRVVPPVTGAPQASGFRTVFSPKTAARQDLFVMLMQIGDAAQEVRPTLVTENRDNIQIAIGDRVAVLGTSPAPTGESFRVTVPAGEVKEFQVLLTDLAAGDWNLSGGGVNWNFQVEAARTTAFFLLPPGEYLVRPGASGDARKAPVSDMPVPEVRNPLAGKLQIDGRIYEITPVVADGNMLVPARATFEALGGRVLEENGRFAVETGGHRIEFQPDSREFFLDGDRLAAAAPAGKRDGVWYVCIAAAGNLSQYEVIENIPNNSAVLVGRPAGDVIWIESNCSFDREALAELSEDHDGKVKYWATSGEGKWFELTFEKPKMLDGFAIRWSQGGARQARFKVEISDGKAWETVFDGLSQKKNELEFYPFEPRKVRQMRFTGYGNTANSWNSIISFLLSEQK